MMPGDRSRRVSTLAAAVLLAALIFSIPCVCRAQDAGPEKFPTARAAIEALITANRNDDTAALNKMFGPDAASLISSGDDTQDKNDRAAFVKLYDEHHELVAAGKEKMTLVVGEIEWRLPIPLEKGDGGWSFDSADGVKELLYRRIGSNELGAIKTCRALYQAQKDYAATGHDGNEPGVYAQRFRSEGGKQNGLYWPVAEGETQSPAGPLVADAESEGYEQGKRQPYHGYYFRILKSQGPNGRGGEKDFVVDGKMTGGFAILAYPAEYGASGVMTFIVSPRGTVFQKDLGDSTADTAKAIKAFNPDSSWTRLPTPTK